MAVDKLVDSTQLDTDLTSVANAIRTKGGTSAQLAFPSGFVDAIDAIRTGGGVTAATGELTLASDFALTISAQNIPGLQLDFQPDFFVICLDRDSFEGISSPGNALYAVLAWRKSMFAPFSNTKTVNLSALIDQRINSILIQRI